jgi:hypothetical protein
LESSAAYILANIFGSDDALEERVLTNNTTLANESKNFMQTICPFSKNFVPVDVSEICLLFDSLFKSSIFSKTPLASFDIEFRLNTVTKPYVVPIHTVVLVCSVIRQEFCLIAKMIFYLLITKA